MKYFKIIFHFRKIDVQNEIKNEKKICFSDSMRAARAVPET